VAVNCVITQALVGISFGTVSAGGVPGIIDTDVWAVVPPVASVTITDCWLVGTPDSTWKLTLDWPETAVTVAGTVNNGLLALRLIVNELEGARLRLMTQLALELGDNKVGVQVNAFTPIFALKDIESLTCMPLATAVIDAIPSRVEASTFTPKSTLVDPAGTLALAGTDTFELLLARVAANPELCAGPVNVSVHFAAPGELTLDGEQFIELSCTDPATVIVVV
jgi:hypothetical protein